MRSTSPAIRRTLQHTPFLTVKLYDAKEKVEAVVDTGASALVVGKHLAPKLGMWKVVQKVKVRQGDGSVLGENVVVNTLFKVKNTFLVIGKFAIDAKVLDIRNRHVILGLSWLMENGFLVDTQDRCLRNIKNGQIISCSLRWIPKVLIMEEEPLENDEILLIIDASK